MMSTESRERQEIEREFHDEWAKSIDVNTLLVRESFEASTAIENAYALELFQSLQGKRLLDLGCGAGETSVYFALLGADVTAVDISGNMLAVANDLAKTHGVTIKTVQSPAETLPFPDSEFDYVFGNGVLHHTNIEESIKETHRVLKTGGLAVFIEPLGYNPVIEVYRHLAHTVRTPTEKPFSFKQLDYMKGIFKSVEHREFWFSTLSVFLYMFLVQFKNPSTTRYWKEVILKAKELEWLFLPLKRLDDELLKLLPPLRMMCWNTVISLSK